MFFKLFIICITGINAARVSDCDGDQVHTNIYEEFIESGSDLSTLFMVESFGVMNPCEKLPVRNRKKYLDNIKATELYCPADWCRTMECKARWTSCPNIEHIIDKSNSDLADCNLDIYGNTILVYSQWNQEIGQLPWNWARLEKIEVYGDIFQKAYDNVLNCDSSCVPKSDSCGAERTLDSSENQIEEFAIDSIGWGIAIVCILVILGVCSVRNCMLNSKIKHFQRMNLKNMDY